MPTYEYRCTACQHTFEEFQSITAPPLRTCPQCGKRRLERLLGTGGGIIFKGSGFYITDYRSEAYKKAAEAEKKSASGGNGQEGGKTSHPTPDAHKKKKSKKAAGQQS